MRQVITPDQMRQIEQAAFDAGTPSLDLMERASQAVANTLINMLGGARGKAAAFFCGVGNNGGDGFAAARLFAAQGGQAYIVLLDAPRTPDAKTNLRRAQQMGIPIHETWPQGIQVDAAVDAIFGIGLNRPLEGKGAEAVRQLNALQIPVLAVDVPSGLDALAGKSLGECVRAHHTITFHRAKTGHYLATAQEALGDLSIADIGLTNPPEMQIMEALDGEDLARLLPERPRASHKGSNGRVLLFGGSMGMAGAAAMAALGCLRAGAGLVTMACEENIIPILQVLVPNATCMPLAQVLEAPPRHDVLLAGCGLGKGMEVWRHLSRLYDADVPTVLDADALNLLAEHPMRLGDSTIITPHVGEAARLLRQTPEQVAGDMLTAGRALQARFGGVSLLKSHCSVITDGQRQALNTIGSPALAKGGSGDALAGIVAGLLAEGMQPYDAARIGALWLGKASILAEQRHGVRSVLTGDVLALMGQAAQE